MKQGEARGAAQKRADATKADIAVMCRGGKYIYVEYDGEEYPQRVTNGWYFIELMNPAAA